jgi:divalent metal cation (Fe/Co/Zn/Cd) transporter
VAYYIVASIFVRMANKPADTEHPYGHRQLEEIQAHRFGPHVEKLILETLPNVLRVHVHSHPADKAHENMTIEEILEEGRLRISPYQPEYYD